MYLLISESSDPYFNLATEEFLLKNSSEEFLFLYINRPCVVVGKHQIVPKEIDSIYLKDNNILISRRLSGGGTVYHDEGNLNFSFVRTVQSGDAISYKRMSQPILNFLLEQDFAVWQSDRNDFRIADRKISGSAMHVYKNRVLAHGTLLINSNLTHLSNALKSHPERFTDKSITSVRSKVMNLSENYGHANIPYLLERLPAFLQKEFPAITTYSLSESMIAEIELLVSNKYSTKDWIYGYSPKYIYQNYIPYSQSIIEYKIESEKGIIKRIKFQSSVEIDKNIQLKLNRLQNLSHNISDLSACLNFSGKEEFDFLLLRSLF